MEVDETREELWATTLPLDEAELDTSKETLKLLVEERTGVSLTTEV